ncbi:MAG: hypothetical protein DMD97_02350 [Candidatus Rokuibacteriota bacterium]|nr:MAG: hypothetical protein DMD97_02350 [Candidatus Rokubacteria bacterium]
MTSRRTEWTAAAAIMLVALALRAYPLHVPYIHPDQEWVPRMALRSILDRSWKPGSALWPAGPYPSGYLYTLRVAYLTVYGAGKVIGWYQDRSDLVAAFVVYPFRFLLAGRLFSCVLGIATVGLTMGLAQTLFGPRAGLVAGALLAPGLLHVRESHYGSLDVPATAFAVATLWAAERARREGSLLALGTAGALAGCAAGYRLQIGVVALALPAAEVLSASRRPPLRVACRLAVASLIALATFGLLSPYTLLEFPSAGAALHDALRSNYAFAGPPSLHLVELLRCGAGTVVCVLTVIGLVAGLSATPKATLTLLAGLAPYALALAFSGRLLARYTVPLFPAIATLAACGVEALARRAPRRARGLALGALVAVAASGPLARSIALDRLLAREDTRLAASRWIVSHIPSGETILIVFPGWFSMPSLPSDEETRRLWGPEVAARVAARRSVSYHLRSYGLDGGELDPNRPPARWIVTAEHPGLPVFGTVPDRLTAFLHAWATPVARFRAFDPERITGSLFDPTDANYLPLRGFRPIERPGPSITVWRVPRRRRVRAAAPPSGSRRAGVTAPRRSRGHVVRGCRRHHASRAARIVQPAAMSAPVRSPGAR